ncbi:hypothetical protein DD509_07935, partial [Dehalogenimonas alkenigignens]
ATDGYGANSVSNSKTWVDARISIGTSGTNLVGDEHIFTVTVEKNDGISWTAAEGVSVTANLSGVGSITSTNPAVTDALGQVTFTVDSENTGTATVNASATVTVGGVPIAVATNGYGALSVSNTKLWIRPDTTVTITPSVWETFPGGNVILTITEKNTGDWPLTNVYVVLDPGAVTFDETSLTWSSDGNADAILDVNETWTWTYQLTISEDTTFIVNGFGTAEIIAEVVSYDNGYLKERAQALVEVNGATRTIGFWKTHWDFTEHAFTTFLGGNINLGSWGGNTWDVTTMEQLMGLFWANPAKNSDGSSRTALDQAKIHTAQQALAAILNDAMTGGAPMPVSLAEIVAVLEGNSIGQVRNLGTLLDAYNNSGDDIALDPSLPPTKKLSDIRPKAEANIPWADTTPDLKGKK